MPDKCVRFKLLETADFNVFTGTAADGIFQLVVTKENADWPYRLRDFIQYESALSKDIILDVDEEDLELARRVYENHNYMDKFLRPYEQKVLVHTTTKENYAAIMQDGYLKSWNLLKSLGVEKEEKPIGYLLGDPPDYSD